MSSLHQIPVLESLCCLRQANEESSPPEEEEQMMCRVCRDTNDTDRMISPCQCRGTMKWVHNQCWERSGGCVPCGIEITVREPGDDPTVALFMSIFSPLASAVISQLEQLGRQPPSPTARIMNRIATGVESSFCKAFVKIMAVYLIVLCALHLNMVFTSVMKAVT